jgi:hypothetical protein
MATNTIPKRRLVRGIDVIPEDWELASGLAALRELSRSWTTLERLAVAAEKGGDKAVARDLRRVQTACSRARDHISGGFDRRHIEPVVRQIERARTQIEREVAHA